MTPCCAKTRSNPARRHRIFRQPLERLYPVGFALKWPYTRDHFIKHEPQRINVARRREFLALKLLRRHIRGRAKDSALSRDRAGGILRTPHPACNAKVCDHRAYILSRSNQHYVAALEVAMQDTGLMRSTQSLAQLYCDRQGFLRLDLAIPLQSGRKCLAWYQFHGKENDFAAVLLVAPDIKDAAHIGMGHMPGQLDFTAKSLQHRMVKRHLR